MTTTFTASNGYRVVRQPDDRLAIFDSREELDRGVRASLTTALREYFQHERDEHLGRWRDPKAPNFVTYHSDIEYVRVVNEATGTSHQAWRDEPRSLSTAKRYFDAHPKPAWHDAQPGEVWVITVNGSEEPAVACLTTPSGGYAFIMPNLQHVGIESDEITAGHRIWPEVDDE